MRTPSQAFVHGKMGVLERRYGHAWHKCAPFVPVRIGSALPRHDTTGARRYLKEHSKSEASVRVQQTRQDQRRHEACSSPSVGRNGVKVDEDNAPAIEITRANTEKHLA